MKFVLLISSMIMGALVSGCDVTAGTGGIQARSQSQDLSYEITENDCSTGKHSFGSNGDYCTGLQNNALNNNCAKTHRKFRFESDCPGAEFRPF